MKTRNTKAKTIAPSKTAPAKKSAPGKNPSSRASTKKKGKTAVKPSEKSAKKEKKSAALKKAVKKSLKVGKNLPASPAPAAKKTSAKKPPAKSAGVKAKAAKKRVAPPNAVRKTAAEKPSKVSLPKAPTAPKKSSPKTKERIPGKKIKAREPLMTKEIKGPGPKLALSRRLRKAVGPARSPEKKSASGEKSKKVFERSVRTELPEEYGENELIVMAVDPNVVFVDWEIRKEEAPETKEGFTMRVFDVTRNESLRLPGDSLFDMKIEGRVGCGFFEFEMPGREVAVEIGVYDNGKFLPILRSPAVSIPGLLVSDELGIAKKMFESEIPVGY